MNKDRQRSAGGTQKAVKAKSYHPEAPEIMGTRGGILSDMHVLHAGRGISNDVRSREIAPGTVASDPDRRIKRFFGARE